MTKGKKVVPRGSLTVEATLILPFVLISWLTIINLLNIYYMQSCIQQALNNTAQRLSEYCYLLERAGLLDDVENIMAMESSTATASSKLKTDLNDMGTHAQNIGSQLENFSISNADAIVNEAKGFVSSAKDAYATLESISPENIKDFFLSELSNGGTGVVTGLFVNSYIQDLKVNTGNISSLDYSKSKFLYGDQYFTIVVTYTYHNPLSIKFFSDVEMMQMVTMRPWVGADGTGLKDLVS
ncbi:MAG: hypothetical protein HDT27_00745 [Subdoligranulum sp.]|nr:hypothetical protein [Subdoligranulum sp.]